MNFIDNSFYKTSLNKIDKKYLKVQLLKKYGFKNIVTEKEKALKETKLINLYATK